MHHIMVIVEHHTDPYYITDYPDVYVVSARQYFAESEHTGGSSASKMPQLAFRCQNIFWHFYMALCILLYILTTIFVLCLSHFRFDRHRLTSCIGLIHLCALNGYLWLYVTALETKIDLSEEEDSNAASTMELLFNRPDNNDTTLDVDASESTKLDWRKRIILQEEYQSLSRTLAEVFFSFMPEMIIINITILLGKRKYRHTLLKKEIFFFYRLAAEKRCNFANVFGEQAVPNNHHNFFY